MRFGIRLAPGFWVGLYPHHHARPCRCRVHRHLLLRAAVYLLLTAVVLDLVLPYALFRVGLYAWRHRHAAR